MSESTSCGLFRRLAAICYDSLLLLALLMIVTAALLTLTGGHAIQSNNLLYDLCLLACSYLYFTWQWIHGGQTLGMRAWKIKVLTLDNNKLGWPRASSRFFYSLFSWAILGIGFIWSLFEKDKMTLHDRLSKTKLTVKRGTGYGSRGSA